MKILLSLVLVLALSAESFGQWIVTPAGRSYWTELDTGDWQVEGDMKYITVLLATAMDLAATKEAQAIAARTACESEISSASTWMGAACFGEEENFEMRDHFQARLDALIAGCEGLPLAFFNDGQNRLTNAGALSMAGDIDLSSFYSQSGSDRYRAETYAKPAYDNYKAAKEAYDGATPQLEEARRLWYVSTDTGCALNLALALFVLFN